MRTIYCHVDDTSNKCYYCTDKYNSHFHEVPAYYTSMYDVPAYNREVEVVFTTGWPSFMIPAYDGSIGEDVYGPFTGALNTSFNDDDKYWIAAIDNEKSLPRIFHACKNLKSINVSNWNKYDYFDRLDSLKGVFQSCFALETITGLDQWPMSTITNIENLFAGCEKLVNFDLSSWSALPDTVSKFIGVFDACKSITKLDLKHITSSIQNIDRCFYDCEALTKINFRNMDFSSLTSANYTFTNCSSLETVVAPPETDWSTTVAPLYNVFNECTNIHNWDGSTDISKANNTKSDGYFVQYSRKYSLLKNDNSTWNKYLVYQKLNNNWKVTNVFTKSNRAWVSTDQDEIIYPDD